MADDTILATNRIATETKAAEPVGATRKTRAPRQKAEPKSAKAVATTTAKAPKATAKAASVASARATRKVKKYTPTQRASILAFVEKATKSGKTTLKAALQQAGVSEQTYYNWRNAAGKTAAPVAANISSGDDLKALVALEAENLKLRKELAICCVPKTLNCANVSAKLKGNSTAHRPPPHHCSFQTGDQSCGSPVLPRMREMATLVRQFGHPIKILSQCLGL